jgi:hypothetical protein
MRKRDKCCLRWNSIPAPGPSSPQPVPVLSQLQFHTRRTLHVKRARCEMDFIPTQCPGVYLGHPVPGGDKYRNLALQFGGVSRIGTIKYGLESCGNQTRAGMRWRGPAATVNYRPVLSSERTLKITNPQLSKENIKEKDKLVADPRWAPDTKTDWPTDCRA